MAREGLQTVKAGDEIVVENHGPYVSSPRTLSIRKVARTTRTIVEDDKGRQWRRVDGCQTPKESARSFRGNVYARESSQAERDKLRAQQRQSDAYGTLCGLRGDAFNGWTPDEVIKFADEFKRRDALAKARKPA